MNNIERMDERNTLWLASQLCLKATDCSRATQTAFARGLIVKGQYRVGYEKHDAYMLTEAGRARLAALDER